MKIDSATPPAVIETLTRAEAPRKAEPAARVTTNEQARMRSIAEEAHDASTRARTERLQDVKAQVARGSYQPDPSRIADQILREAEMSAKLRSMLR